MTGRIASTALAMLLLAAPAAAEPPSCAGFPEGASTHNCTCGPGPHGAPVWGSGPYTADSDLCTAAQHAGVLPEGGGSVLAMSVTPPDSYAGTVANGVTTADWGTYDRAFEFLGAEPGQAGLPLCRSFGEAAEVTCLCGPGSAAGAVWGSGPYTADSDICTAALHAGAIGPEGGPVTAVGFPGQESYPGSSANGVMTSDWGSYGASFDFAPPQPKG